MSNTKFYKDFDLYSRALMGSNDVDPTYPVIKSIVEKEGFDPYWFSFVYVAFYSLETAIKMCREMPTHEAWDSKLFAQKRSSREWSKFGHERRGTARNILTQINNFDHIKTFLDYVNTPTEEIEPSQYPKEWANMYNDQASFRSALQTLPFHGGWASFKLAEIWEKSFDWNHFEIPDLGVIGRDPNSNDGPVGGLRWLYGREHAYDDTWYGIWDDLGSKLAKAWQVDIGRVETCLCKFHKLVSGKYYIGHDIHEFHELEPVLSRKVYRSIMEEHFDLEIWQDFHGVQKQFKSVYASKGDLLFSNFADKYPEADVLQIMLDQ